MRLLKLTFHGKGLFYMWLTDLAVHISTCMYVMKLKLLLMIALDEKKQKMMPSCQSNDWCVK